MPKALLISLLGLLALALPAAGQERLAFEGVEVGGKVEDCIKALRKKKFKPTGHQTLRGRYQGDDVALFVGYDPADGQVSMISVTYDADDSWPALVNRYETAKMMLSLRYGPPALTKEAFDYPYTEKDGLRALEYDKCHYTCAWSLSGGDISLHISQTANLQIFFVARPKP